MSRQLKTLIFLVWSVAIAFRAYDLRQAQLEQALTPNQHPAYVHFWIQADVLAIILSLLVIGAGFLLIGRSRFGLLEVISLIILSKILVMVADARVGDLPFGDIFATHIATFILPSMVCWALLRAWPQQSSLQKA